MAEERIIRAGTEESREVVARVDRAMRLSERMASLRYEDADEVRAAWGELTGQPVDATFRLVPPVRSDHGLSIRVGRNVFVNHGCTLNDIGGIEIGDDVMLGPNVSLLTSGHPLDPATRRRAITAAPIRLGNNVWIGASAIVLQGVTIGDDSVVAAGAVVTRDVPAGVLVAGVPARVVRSIATAPPPAAVRVEPVVTRPLRNAVLRPGLDLDAVHWPDIERPDAVTYAVLADDGTPLTTATVIPAPCPWRPDDQPSWQLRGMATSEAARGRGVGRLALDACIAHVQAAGAALLWCNARDVALSFYERAGFVIEGDGFVSETGIPHHPMRLDLG